MSSLHLSLAVCAVLGHSSAATIPTTCELHITHAQDPRDVVVRELRGQLEAARVEHGELRRALEDSQSEAVALRAALEARSKAHERFAVIQRSFVDQSAEARQQRDELQSRLNDALLLLAQSGDDGAATSIERLELQWNERETRQQAERRWQIEREALREAVRRLEARLVDFEPAAVRDLEPYAAKLRGPEERCDVDALPWLSPAVDESDARGELRHDLAIVTGLDVHGIVPNAWIIDYVRVAAGVPIVLLPDAAHRVAGQSGAVHRYGLPQIERLARAVAPAGLRVRDRDIMIGTDADFGALDRALLADRHPEDVEAQAFRSRIAATLAPVEAEGVTALELVSYIEAAGDLALWVAPAGREQLGSCMVHLDAPGGLGLDTLIQILAHASGTSAALVDGVLVLDADGAPRVAPLAPEVRAALPETRAWVQSAEKSLRRRLQQLSAVFGLELRLGHALRDELGDHVMGALEVKDTALAFWLRMVVHELRDHTPVRWVRSDAGLELVPE